VQRNIERFGGDSRNVTILGQSAGSMSVAVLQSSPQAKDLFQHVIGMSGGPFGSAVPGGMQKLDAAEQGGHRMQERLKTGSLAAMRSVPADRILAAQLDTPLRYGPIVDGYVLPETPAEIFAHGRQNDVPALIGFTHDESFSELSRVTTLTAWKESVQRLYGDKAQSVLALYPAKDDATARTAATLAARDSTVALQMRSWARAQAATGKAPVYAYLFSRVHPYVEGVTFSDHDPKTVGAYHTGDVPYWLETLDSLNLFRVTRHWTDFDRKLADEMSNAIVAFATSGNPHAKGAGDWPQYRADREQIREFGDKPQVIAWPDVKQIEFFALNPPMPATPGATRPRD
jgi:para-nitrobenzyl esterase